MEINSVDAFESLGNILANPVKEKLENMIKPYSSAIFLGAIGYGVTAIFENGKWIVYKLLPDSFFKEALVSAEAVYTLSCLGTACGVAYKELPFWQKVAPTIGVAIYYGIDVYNLHQAGLDYKKGSVINKAHSMLGLYLSNYEIKKMVVEYSFDLGKITILAQAVKKLHGFGLSAKEVKEALGVYKFNLEKINVLAEAMEKLQSFSVSIKEMQEILDAYEFNLDKVNILAETMKQAKGFGLSVQEVQEIADLGHVNKLGNDDSYLSLLADYARISDNDAIARLKDLKLDAEDVKQNQQSLLKEFLNSLPPLSKAMVEFASFYVPKNLSWEKEMEINAFINRDDEYAKGSVSLYDLSINKALIGQDMKLMQDLREFFVAEGQRKFGSIAPYLQRILSLGEKYTEHYGEAFEGWLAEYAKEKNKIYRFKLLEFYTDTDAPKPNPALEDFHTLTMFNYPQTEAVKYLDKASNLKTLPQLVRFLREYSKEMPLVDLLGTYQHAEQYFNQQVQLMNWFSDWREFYKAVYQASKFPHINEYIINKAKDAALTSCKAAGVEESDMLLSLYWMANAQNDVLQRLHHAIKDRPEWSMKFIYAKLVDYALEVEKDKEKAAFIFQRKLLDGDASSIEEVNKLDYFYATTQYITVFNIAKTNFDRFAKFANPDSHFNGDTAKIIENEKLLSLFHILKIIHSDYALLERKVAEQLITIAKSGASAIIYDIIKIRAGHLQDMQYYSEQICDNRGGDKNAFADIICGLAKGVYFNAKYVDSIGAKLLTDTLAVMGKSNDNYYSLTNEELLGFLTDSSKYYKNSNVLLKANAAIIDPEQAQYLSFTLKSLELPNLLMKIQMQKELNLEYQYDCEYLKEYVSNSAVNYTGQYEELCAVHR